MIRKISLKPLDRFFFGGENSFAEAGDEDNRRATYLLRSRNYPQQTSLLGLIRNQLLLQNDLLWDNTTKVNDRRAAKALIGPHGFQITHTGNYGVVQSIGPVFLTDAAGTAWWPAPLDDVLMEKGDDPPYPMQLHSAGGIAILKGYTPKSGLYATLQNQQDEVLSVKKTFLDLEQVGITKAAKPWGNAVTEDDDERGYYYQTFKQFAGKREDQAGPTQFSFYLQLNDNVDFKLDSAIVEMGGERSTFQMTVEDPGLNELPEVESVAYVHTQRDTGLKSIVCQSPTLVTDMAALRKYSLLIVSDLLPFRFLKSSLEKTDGHAYQRLQRDGGDKPQRGLLESKRFELLDRGSVIHFDPANESKITPLLTHASLQGIGYNQYCTL